MTNSNVCTGITCEEATAASLGLESTEVYGDKDFNKKLKKDPNKMMPDSDIGRGTMNQIIINGDN